VRAGGERIGGGCSAPIAGGVQLLAVEGHGGAGGWGGSEESLDCGAARRRAEEYRHGLVALAMSNTCREFRSTVTAQAFKA
jgi:hypothetical protein